VISGFDYEKAVKPNVSNKYFIGIERYKNLQKMIDKQIKDADVVQVWTDVDAKSVGGDGFHLPESSQKKFADYVAKKVLRA
jgi:hypothetical protein